MDASQSARRWTRGARLVAVWVAAAGCSVAGRHVDRVPSETRRSELRQTDPISVQQFARSAPVTVEQGAAQISQEALENRPSPASLNLSLEEVRAASLANNLDLDVELVSPSLAMEQIGIEEGRFDALLAFSINRDHFDTPGIPLSTSSQFDSRFYEAGILFRSRSGGTFRIDRPLDKSASTGLPAEYESDLRFSISQPLLRNAGVRTNNAPIRIARFQALQADAFAKLQVITVLAAADRQYWQVWAARRQLEIARQQFDLSVQQLRDVEKRFEANDVAGNEIVRAEAGIAQRVESIIFAETALEIAQRELKRIMNRPDLGIETVTAIQPVSEPQLLGLQLDQEAAAVHALNNRMELIDAELQLSIDSINADVAQNARLPLATLDWVYNFNGTGRGFGRANDVLRSHDFADYTLGLNVTFPVPNQTARARRRQALLARLQTSAVRDQLRLRVRQQVYDSLNRIDQDWRRILAARNDVQFAAQNLEVERQLFRFGQQNRTSTEVLDALGRLAQAQLGEVRAITDYQVSLVNLAFATGTLLGYSRIRWEPSLLSQGRVWREVYVDRPNIRPMAPSAPPSVPKHDAEEIPLPLPATN